MIRSLCGLMVIVNLLILPCRIVGLEVTSVVNADYWHFIEESTDKTVEQHNYSAALLLELFQEWPDLNQSLLIKPFQRIDATDKNRTHFDFRELYWLLESDNWEFSIGLKKIFWGVTESQHLVDIINQTDLVENPDGSEKLGQPMILFSRSSDMGLIDIFVLTGFRNRTFPREESRFRLPFPLDDSQPVYESDQNENHIDGAIRFSNTLGDLDFGLSYFSGTSRDPEFKPDSENSQIMVPYYRQIQQSGVDLQWINSNWIWKFELIHRSNQDNAWSASTFGFEYVAGNIFETGKDVSLFIERLYDSRVQDADTPFENDIFAALVFSFNDEQSPEASLVVVKDLERSSRMWQISVNRRIGDNWKFELAGNFYENIESEDPLYYRRKDSYLKSSLNLFF